MNGDAKGKFICSVDYILNFKVGHCWDIGEGRALKDWVGCSVGRCDSNVEGKTKAVFEKVERLRQNKFTLPIF